MHIGRGPVPRPLRWLPPLNFFSFIVAPLATCIGVPIGRRNAVYADALRWQLPASPGELKRTRSDLHDERLSVQKERKRSSRIPPDPSRVFNLFSLSSGLNC